MYVVTNISDETQRFHEIDPQGGLRIVALPAGESGTFDIDPLHGRFHRGALTAIPYVEKPAKAKRSKRAKA